MRQHFLMKIQIVLTLAGLLFAAFILLPATATAQEPDYTEITQVAKQLNCPTCQGINLADCRTVTCAQWRGQISTLLQEGYTEQEVLDYFAARYGTQVLQEPPRSGFTLFLWLLPAIILLLGGGWLYVTLRGWSKPQPVPVTPTTPGPSPTASNVSDDYLSQVERDLGLDEV